jgi:hypothetical protein
MEQDACVSVDVTCMPVEKTCKSAQALRELGQRLPIASAERICRLRKRACDVA